MNKKTKNLYPKRSRKILSDKSCNSVSHKGFNALFRQGEGLNRKRHQLSPARNTYGKAILNQRKHHRISMLATLELTLEGGYCLEGYIINVSYGGLGLYTKNALLAGTKIHIKFSYMNGLEEKFSETLLGNVVWCRPVGKLFGMGIQFKGLELTKHAKLIHYMEGSKTEKQALFNPFPPTTQTRGY